MAVLGNKMHTTATLLFFANPPAAADPEPIAAGCVSSGLEKIGIPGPHNPSDLIDFGTIDEESCVDFAQAVEICTDENGFVVPSLAGSFVLLHEKGTAITVGNLAKAIALMMKPKA
jgi:hypothetical protein